MFSWLKSQRERWMKRREERRAGVAERTLRRNEANALRRRDDRNGPMSGPGI